MRSVAFLRSINVTGRRATSDRLVEAVAGLGLGRVDTFLASGNVLFEPATTLDEADLSEALARTLG